MNEETLDLLKEISKMNNVYGFCARHYVTSDSSLILETYKAMKEGGIFPGRELREKLIAFAEKAKDQIEG